MSSCLRAPKDKTICYYDSLCNQSFHIRGSEQALKATFLPLTTISSLDWPLFDRQRERNGLTPRLLKKWLMDWNTPCEAMCFGC